MIKDIKNKDNLGKLKCELSYIANNYVTSYKPTKSTLIKHGILKKLRSNDNIVIVKPDKGSGVVILNKSEYIVMINEIIIDKTKSVAEKRYI